MGFLCVQLCVSIHLYAFLWHFFLFGYFIIFQIVYFWFFSDRMCRPENVSLFPPGPKVRELELTSNSFKIIVLRPQTKVPLRLRSESSTVSRLLLLTGVANIHTLYVTC